MTANETFLQPNRALRGASDLTAAGSAFYSKWTQLSGRITELNAAAPWGTDEPGRKFAEQYVGGGGGDNVAQQTIDAGNSMAPVLRDLGADVRQAVNGTTGTDDLIGKWFPEA